MDDDLIDLHNYSAIFMLMDEKNSAKLHIIYLDRANN